MQIIGQKGKRAKGKAAQTVTLASAGFSQRIKRMEQIRRIKSFPQIYADEKADRADLKDHFYMD